MVNCYLKIFATTLSLFLFTLLQPSYQFSLLPFVPIVPLLSALFISLIGEILKRIGTVFIISLLCYILSLMPEN